MSDLISKKCLYCGNNFEVKQFPTNKLCKDGFECYCKKCKKSQVTSKELLIEYLKMNSLQFNDANWKASLKWAKDRELKKHKDRLPDNFNAIVDCTAIGKYFQQCNISGDFEHSKLTVDNSVKRSGRKVEVSAELVDKWGVYKPEEILLYEGRYQKLKNSFQLPTESHKEFLKKACVCGVKADMAMAKDDVNEAKKWMDMFKDITTSGKIAPNQMSKADLSGGLDTFGQLARHVEIHQDIIPLLPKYLKRPQDDIDFTILCYINYERALHDLPLCKYEDLYEFIQKRKREYEEMQNHDYIEEGEI